MSTHIKYQGRDEWVNKKQKDINTNMPSKIQFELTFLQNFIDSCHMDFDQKFFIIEKPSNILNENLFCTRLALCVCTKTRQNQIKQYCNLLGETN